MIDIEAERKRLNGQLEEAEGEIRRMEGKLGNEQFRSKAPAEIIAREEAKLEAALARTTGLKERLSELE
jgi:valyl-tRNA synthetase